MTLRTPLLLALLLGTSATGIALAADPPAPPKPRPAALDTNNDGVIDRQEAAASPRLAARFDQLDADKDGRLSREERRRGERHGHRGHGPGRGEAMAKLDTDKDGRVSREEAKADARLSAHFDAMDLDKDGYLDTADHDLRRTQQRDAWFTAADTNKDGQLSKAEFDAAKGPMHGPRREGPRPR